MVSRARADAVARAIALGAGDCADAAALVISELMTNALFHGDGCRGYDITPIEDGVRIEVRDCNRIPPVVGHASSESLTGRGLRLVAAASAAWGAQLEGPGKTVWAEITAEDQFAWDLDEDDLLAMWDDDWAQLDDEHRVRVELGSLPTDLLLAAKMHVDSVVREFTLASAGARTGVTGQIPPQLVEVLDTVVAGFAEARLAIKHAALAAARKGAEHTDITLELPPSAADAAEAYLEALAEVDAYCRARRMLTLETPPQHRVFREWYVGELVTQLRSAAAGQPPPKPVPFERRLLAELDRVAVAQRATQRAARMYTVAAALVSASTPEQVADVVLNEGVAALGASGGGVLLPTDVGTLAVPGAVGYDEATLRRLRNESRDAELPAAEALRTGRPVWLESRTNRDAEFPQLSVFEPDTVALCAVPLLVGERCLGALRFSFNEPRLFDDDERRFVLALAAETAEALDRAQLQQSLTELLASERAAREALDREHRVVDSLDRVGRALTSRLELGEVVQEVIDATTELTSAELGVFFSNAVDEAAGSPPLYSVSGAPAAVFERLPHPGDTEVFRPAFTGEAVVRLADVTSEPQYRSDDPFFALLEGHLPARSYLAVPVADAAGQLVGGLLYAHSSPGHFGAEHERLVSGVAPYAAIAMRNARLYADARRWRG